jgi:hypothetical protein
LHCSNPAGNPVINTLSSFPSRRSSTGRTTLVEPELAHSC